MKPISDESGADRYHVELVARTINVLRHLAELHAPASLADLAAQLGWNKATLYRMLRTLEAIGAVRQSSGGYVVGPAMITIGQSALRALRLPEIAQPHLQWLHDRVNETTNLAVLDRDEILIVERVEDRQILGMRLHVGSRLPAYCTSVGHVLLAGLPVHEVARRLEGVSLVVHGPSTITSLPRLLQRLEEVRAQGYALSDEELAVGHRAVAAPVRDWNGDVIAAINVSVPSARVSADEMRERVSPLVREAARAIESDLRGFGGAVRAGQVAAGRSGK